ncbi:hypothetical protein [Streptomyces sp. NPDC002671]
MTAIARDAARTGELEGPAAGIGLSPRCSPGSRQRATWRLHRLRI